MKHPIAVRFIGDTACPIRHNDRPFIKGDVASVPADVMALLLARADFEPVLSDDEPATSHPETEDAPDGAKE